MDRIVAGDLLSRDDTNWDVWIKRSPIKSGYDALHDGSEKRQRAEEEDSHVGHVLGHMREGGRKFVKSPKLKSHEPVDSCRIFGSIEGNKVQGDFHITARGHGYMEQGAHRHLDHGAFNFSHHINELSFGPHYPNLLNPLDRTSDTTGSNFYKFQYFLSIVPTIFTKRRVSTDAGILDPAAVPQPPTLDMAPVTKKDKDGLVRHYQVAKPDHKSVFTNQYAATSQSREVPPNTIPGIFFKYDIEPILLVVSEQRGGILALAVRLVNVISGILVGGGWLFQLTEWAGEVVNRRRRRGSRGADYGVLHGRAASQ